MASLPSPEKGRIRGQGAEKGRQEMLPEIPNEVTRNRVGNTRKAGPSGRKGSVWGRGGLSVQSFPASWPSSPAPPPPTNSHFLSNPKPAQVIPVPLPTPHPKPDRWRGELHPHAPCWAGGASAGHSPNSGTGRPGKAGRPRTWLTSPGGRRAPHLTEASAVIPTADPDAAATAAAAASAASAFARSSKPGRAWRGLHNGHELFSKAFGLLIALFLRHEALAAQRVPAPAPPPL